VSADICAAGAEVDCDAANVVVVVWFGIVDVFEDCIVDVFGGCALVD